MKNKSTELKTNEPSVMLSFAYDASVTYNNQIKTSNPAKVGLVF